MTEYLIAFNDEWVPDHTVEELREKSKAVRALVALTRWPPPRWRRADALCN
jgi:hypothetical protein